MTLADLPDHQPATITAIDGDPATCIQLMEAGFTPGQSVRVVARSPLGDPLAIALRGAILALRKEEARCILV
jgi:ferrous iron transport protein A